MVRRQPETAPDCRSRSGWLPRSRSSCPELLTHPPRTVTPAPRPNRVMPLARVDLHSRDTRSPYALRGSAGRRTQLPFCPDGHREVSDSRRFLQPLACVRGIALGKMRYGHRHVSRISDKTSSVKSAERLLDVL